jgi:predicted Zn-dependent protease
LEEVAVTDSSGLEELLVGLSVEVIAEILQGGKGQSEIRAHGLGVRERCKEGLDEVAVLFFLDVIAGFDAFTNLEVGAVFSVEMIEGRLVVGGQVLEHGDDFVALIL